MISRLLENIGYEVGTTGYSITWNLSDTDPASYIYRIVIPE